jgi:hypothetical protein
MQQFTDDDQGHLGWLANYPAGFVVNVRRVAGPSYAVLHRATCHTIASARDDGAYTERAYRKVVASDLDSLRSFTRSIGRQDGSFSGVCGHCHPVRAQ